MSQRSTPPNLMSTYSESNQSLQRHLVVRVGAVLVITLMIIIASALYFVFLTDRQAWLPFIGGMLIIVSVAVWVISYILKQTLDQSLTGLQANLERLKQDQPDQLPEIFGNEYDNPTENQDQLTAEEEAAVQTTGLKLTEAEFEEIREQFDQLSELEFEAIAIHEKVNLVDTNQTMAMMFGYTPLELVNLTLMDLAAPESRSMVLKNTLLGYEKPYVAIGLKKDGATFPVEILSQITSHQGQTVTVIGIREITERSQAEVFEELQKIRHELETQVEQSTAELRNANERLQLELNERKETEAEIFQRNRELTVLQSASIAITSSLDLRYVLDTVAQEMTKLLDVESCTISEWNQTEDTVSTIARYGPDGWWHPSLTPKTRDLADYPLTREVLEEPIPEQMTISQPYVDPAEAAYMQEANLKTRLMLPMNYQGRIVGLVELEDSRVERTFDYREISLAKLLANQAASATENAHLYQQAQQEIIERKQAEAALEDERALLAQRVQERTAELSKANAELARAARLKDEFLAAMSHELRTPLNAILGSAEILRTEVFGALNENQLKYSQNIEEGGRHLLELINDILDLSKIEAGRMELDLGPVSVQSVCQASLRLVKQLAFKKQLQLSNTLDDSVTTLLADERRLKQILVNLLSNAIKFTPEGGEIGLEVVGDAEQQIVHFTVWDTGIGISQEDMSRLFQPFMQLDSKLSRRYAGTGLGLSLVSRMTELHAGGVSVESKVGQGSRFTVSFPWWDPAEPATSGAETRPTAVERLVAPDPGGEVKQPRILLADDNEDNINLLLDYLQTQRFQMVVARNGQEAIDRANEEKPDVILMDIQMPGMDGLEATRRMRTDALLATVPIIAITALAMPGDRERCLAAGANEYLSKPVNLRKLVQTIESQLNRHSMEKEYSL